jgi:hypothetical protein
MQQDPELLDTVFISHSLLTESADLELHMALQKLSSSSSSSSGGGGGGSSSAGAGYRRPDEATVMAAAGSIGEAAKKFDRVRPSWVLAFLLYTSQPNLPATSARLLVPLW